MLADLEMATFAVDEVRRGPRQVERRALSVPAIAFASRASSTSERLTVHRLNDEVGAEESHPGQQVMLHWAAEHSYIVGSEVGAAEIAAPARRPTRRAP